MSAALAHIVMGEGECSELLARERHARAAAEAAHTRSALMAETSAVLDGSLDWANAVQSVARLAVQTFADWCIIDVIEPDQTLRRAAVAHADPADAGLAEELQRSYLPDPSAQHGIGVALRSGQPVLISAVSSLHLAAVARDAEHMALLRRLEIGSVVSAPLRARGHILGTITFLSAGTTRRYGPSDLALAEELAYRVAIALDNTWLYEKTQQAVQVRDQFLAMASHDLRTPLSHIKAFVSTLLQTDVEWDEATRRDFLTEAERSADRLDKLIGDLLDMSRIDSGGLDAGARVPTEPAALVASGLESVRGLLGERAVLVDVPAELPAVAVDAAQLERVIANLVENAAKYAPPGSRITIRGASVDGFLELRVEDEGAGIPPEQLEQIFEKFFRGQKSEHSGIPGTGLGLAICRGIVRAHGGRIWAENRTEGGARFVVALPIATAGLAGRTAASVSHARSSDVQFVPPHVWRTHREL